MKPLSTIHRSRHSLKNKRLILVLLIAALLVVPFRSPFVASATTETTVVLQTAAAPMLQSTSQVISNEFGNQTNPHVDCNLASYTFDDFQGISTIHYQDLTTGADSVIPGNQVDLLSDISGSRVAWTEVTFTGDTVRVFDTNSQTTTVVPGLGNSSPSIGGNLVAFEQRSSPAAWQVSEIALYDLTTETVSPLTNDSLFNHTPNVSPNGNAVVWEKCQTNGLDCAVYSGVQTAPGVFTTRALTAPGSQFSLPSTNGYVAVYTSDRTGDRDVYFQSITGGTETHLAIPGDQRWARISGDLISFESLEQGNYDIFLYDTRSGNLFRVTNSAGVSETLNDISVCNGLGRIVYSIPGDGSFDVDAITFPVPSVNEDQLGDLIALVRGFNLPPGTANSLVRKLQNALDAINSGDLSTACSSLTAFKNECAAQSGKKLTTAQASQLINAANLIKANLGCP